MQGSIAVHGRPPGAGLPLGLACSSWAASLCATYFPRCPVQPHTARVICVLFTDGAP